ncbi:MAG: hypothetical protein HC929_25345, partial [Leptolyngbyaceae cyanobacterium SM2_5_2]|nr:hypothetical protein [Leptolyngbyaceae cyanobacterium SM2_5_2]
PSQGEELQAKAPNEGCDLSCSRPSPPRLGKAESQTLTARAREPIDRQANRDYLQSDRHRRMMHQARANSFAQKAVRFGGELRPAAGLSADQMAERRYVAEQLYLWRTGDPELRAEVSQWLARSKLAPELREKFRQC